MKKLGLSLMIVAISILLIGNIYHNSGTTVIEYDNKTYLSANYIESSIINTVIDPDIIIYEIADDIRSTNDSSSYVFVALVVGLLGFVITRIYLKHMN